MEHNLTDTLYFKSSQIWFQQTRDIYSIILCRFMYIYKFYV
jgi:hypothetical protein